MPDFLTPEQRSARMSRIRSSNTAPELALRRALHALGLRFRVNDNRLPGKPDIVLPRFKTVIFVHGCFWHRHDGCKVASTPKSNAPFWEEKFARNVARDKMNVEKLKDLGWQVLTAWECEVASTKKAADVAAEISVCLGHTRPRKE
ncbi:DNA mismatch endonuclease Vsr [Agrobacterium vitis]|uniref:DNA mismatch endonuclease Vsr n=1 Tax=Allorhizobium ampelinum TaxID=3025782 RepID=UPI001F212ED7|nr:DNA mismatch endonuclease Vsr [Allorhizobium ampelinum]MCF1464049.1 DNA mismatch endonuclease Vsr [Allorhizobium ampelinum]